jgi:hypothetical protein
MPQVLGRILQKRYAQNRQDDGRIEAKYAWQSLPSAVSCGDVPAEQNDLVTTRFSYPITVIQAGFLTSPEAGRESADVSEQAVHGAEAGAPSPSSENLSINSRHRRRGGTLKLGVIGRAANRTRLHRSRANFRFCHPRIVPQGAWGCLFNPGQPALVDQERT